MASGSPRAAAGDRWLLVAGVVAVVLPLLVASGRLILDRDFHPTLDHALIELNVRDVGRHEVLLGPFSREGWNHPGPTLFYLLALPYRLFGGDPVGLLIGALVINGASAAGMVTVAWHRGGRLLFLITVMGVLTLMRALGADLLADPWNPYVAVLPFGLLVFLTWEMTTGARWLLPVAVGVGSFLVQTHVSFAPVSLTLLLLGGAALTVRTFAPGEDAPTSRRSLAWATTASAVIAALLWTPPVFEQVFRSGNLARIFEYFTEPKAHQSASAAYRTIALQFGWTPEWAFGARPTGLIAEVPYRSAPVVPVLLLLLVAATLTAWRRRWSDVSWLGAVVLVATAVAGASVSRIAGPILFYLVRWTWVLGMVAGVVVLWLAARLVRAFERPRARRGLLAALGVGIAILSTATVVAASGVDVPNSEGSAIAATLAEQVLDELPPDEPVLLQWGGGAFASYPWAVAASLERHGVEVEVGPEGRETFGERRAKARPSARRVVFVAEGNEIDRRAGDPGSRRIARAGDRPPGEAAAIRARRSELEDRHRRGELSDEQYLRAAASLPEVGTDVAVFLVDRADGR